MRKAREPSEEIVIEEGLRQGVFTMIMDDDAKEIKSRIKQTRVGYKCLETVILGNVCFQMI